MKKVLTAVLAGLALVCMMTGPARACLTTIGTATYDDGSGAANYNLIWDNDNNGNSVVWLDYSNAVATWSVQKAWAAGLNETGILAYNIDPAYAVDWGSSAWRLPSTVDNSSSTWTDKTTSEIGHLYYTELGNTTGLTNTGDFDHLVSDINHWTWSGTEHADNTYYVWAFKMYDGSQYYMSRGATNYGLAVRSGQVSAVPVPGAIWLLGSGLIGLLGIRRRKQG